jgi:hypothetical protein
LLELIDTEVSLIVTSVDPALAVKLNAELLEHPIKPVAVALSPVAAVDEVAERMMRELPDLYSKTVGAELPPMYARAPDDSARVVAYTLK